MAAPDPSAMFEPEVVAELRRQFDEADKDGSGELDAAEACKLFARTCCDEDASDDQIQKLASNLRNQMDSDRSGTISFNEYCFRFGRRYQQELRRRRSAGTSSPSLGASAANAGESEAAAELRREREALEREREALKHEREEMNRARSGSRTADSPTSQATAPPAAQAPAGFPSGARILIQGLRGAAELNGRNATVVRFDDASGRYVVQLDGNGGQKSLRPENLANPGSSGASRGASSATPSAPGAFSVYSQKAKDGLRNAAAQVQVWMAGYEWWQLALGAALVLLMLGAWVQVSSRSHYSRYGDSATSRRAAGTMPGRDTYTYDDAPPLRETRDDFDYDRSDHQDRNYREERQRNHRQRPQYDDDYDNGGGYDGGGGGGGLLSGLSGGNNQMMTMVLVGGLGYACWKGIIPVHKMSWFQLYMLWNMISPLILGGRGGGMGMGGGGFGRGRRRGFF